MLKNLLFLLLLISSTFFTTTTVSAQVQEGTLLGNWQNDDLPEMFYGRYNEVWGIEVNGVEYGVIGSTMGVHFISLEPVNGVLEEVAFVAGAAQGSNIIHRDYHSYGNYLYAVADEGASTLQIIDFSNLPASVSLVYDSDEFITTAHNIFIDEDNARLYSTNSRVLSLANPEQPTLLSQGFFGGHDIFVRDDMLIVNEGYNGMRFIDYTDVNNPIVVGSLSDYFNGGYNHSGWMSEDNSHYFLCDETGGSFVKSVNITDFNNIEIVDMFKADNENENHIAHNALVKNNLLYVSYYSDGIQIFDVTDPANVVRKYFYDTYPGMDNSGFKGAWGTYNFLNSGRILVSDMASGLFLLDFPADQTIFTLNEDIVGCATQDLSFDVLVGTDFSNNGTNLSVNGLPSGATATFSENPASPGAIVEVVLSGIDASIDFDLQVTADDGSANTSMSVPIAITPAPQPLALNQPANEMVDVSLEPLFDWESIPGVQTLLEVSTSSDFSTIDISQILFTNSYIPSTELAEGVTYYWRVSYQDDCGMAVSDVYSFTTAIIISVDDIIASTVAISPNPVQDEIIIETGEYFQEDLEVELFDINGRSIKHWTIFNNNETFTLVPPSGLEGLFLLQLSNTENTLTKKVLFEK